MLSTLNNWLSSRAELLAEQKRTNELLANIAEQLFYMNEYQRERDQWAKRVTIDNVHELRRN